MPSTLRSRTPRKALSKSGSGSSSSFDFGDPGSSELDSVSTNGSVSGESEDQQQLQKPAPAAAIPGMDFSSEKQEKIRLKNERKHQRHKERKLKELKERCRGILMRRKLQSLVFQLTSMGFTSDRAAAALALHDGDVEKSITFLLDGGGTLPKPGEPPLKLDISRELEKLGEIEARGYPMPDIERAVVACDGDLDAVTRLLQENAGVPGGFTPGIADAFPRGSEARGGGFYHPAAHHHHQQRDLVADWRSSNPARPVAGAQRVNISGFHQQEVFQQPVAHHQGFFNQVNHSSPAPGSWSPSWSWDVSSAPPRVDYQAIDWSVGKPMSWGGNEMQMQMPVPHQMPGLQQMPGAGFREMVSQEWTSPFAGKDLFHQVHSL